MDKQNFTYSDHALEAYKFKRLIQMNFINTQIFIQKLAYIFRESINL